MKRTITFLTTLLLLMLLTPAHAALITVDGSFEQGDLVSGGYDGSTAWHTDGFVLSSPGGAAGTATYAQGSDDLCTFYALFQVVEVDWGDSLPDATSITIDFDQKTGASCGYLSYILYGSNTEPVTGSLPTDGPYFGDAIYTALLSSVSSATWEGVTVTDAEIGSQSAYTYYTLLLYGTAVDLDNVAVMVEAVPVPVPAPAAVLLLGGGLAGLAGLRSGRRR